MTHRDIVVAGALVRHQTRVYLDKLGVEWREHKQLLNSTFVVDATEEQWMRIQDWVKKVTG